MKRGRPVVPFAPELAPLGDPMQAIYQRASEAEDDVIHLIRQARQFLYLGGYTLKGWTMNMDFVATLQETVPHLKKPLRVLITDPENPTLKLAMRSEDVWRDAQQSASTVARAWQRLISEVGNGELRANVDRATNYQIVISENEAIVIPYLTSRDTQRSPYIYARRESFYHDALKEEFEFIWQQSSARRSQRLAQKPKEIG